MPEVGQYLRLVCPSLVVCTRWMLSTRILPQKRLLVWWQSKSRCRESRFVLNIFIIDCSYKEYVLLIKNLFANYISHSKLSEFELVDCSKYWKLDKLGAGNGYVNLKTYINCIQGQMLKIQKQIVKLTTGKIIMTIMTKIHPINHYILWLFII